MTPLVGENYVLLHGDTASSLFNEAHTGSSECPPGDLEDLVGKSISQKYCNQVFKAAFKPLLIFVFHAGSNRNLHNESTVLFWEFKDKTRWWIVHKMMK